MYQNKIFENNLRLYRQRMLLKQNETALLLEQKGQSQICHWEKGGKVPSFDNLILLSILYQTSIEKLYQPYYILLENKFKPRIEKWRSSVNYYDRISSIKI